MLRITEPADCGVFREFVFHYQAEELAEADRRKLDEHLAECRKCTAYLELENSFLRGLRSRLKRDEAPRGLEGRIRQALEAEAPTVSSFPGSWLRTPAASALAAAVMLVALLVPTFRTRTLSVEAAPGSLRVNRAVTVVDADCDAAGRSLAEQRACRDSGHLNALKVADGEYWNVNPDSPQARSIVLDPVHRGRRVVVEANYYPELHTVRLLRVTDRLPVIVQP